ncbi:hypothetical protein BDZ97DRAFT_1836899 [Flammula alnicola]|nr:hypothetical protein BDZ97DRAFT_1836899 [Flammula alnicola]
MGIELTESIATYLRAKFKNEMAGAPARAAFPDHFSLLLLQECDHLVNVLVAAYRNRKTTSWAVDSYAAYLADTSPKSTGRNERYEEQIKKYLEGNILVWYMPACLLKPRQVRAMLLQSGIG